MKYLKPMEDLNTVISPGIVIGRSDNLALIRSEVGEIYCIEDEDEILEIGEIMSLEGLKKFEEA